MREQKALVDRINHLCWQSGISYYELAYRSAVPLTTLTNIMKSRTKNPGICTIMKICNGFGITLSEFFNAEEFRDIEFEPE